MKRALVVLLLCGVWGCKKEPAPAAPPKAPGLPKPRTDQAEVEIGGTFSPGATHPAKVWLAVLDAPCLPVPAEAKVIGRAVPTNERFFLEIFVPQGTQGYICLYGLDEAGKVIAAAAYEKNPFVMKGEGEVEASMKLELKAVEASEPPKGLAAKK